MSAQAERPSLPTRFTHFAIRFFGGTMGLFGLAIVLRSGGLELPSVLLGYGGLAVLVVLADLFALKAARHPVLISSENCPM